MNQHSIALSPLAFASNKGAWQWAIAEALHLSGMRRGLKAMTVTVTFGFERYDEVDEDNILWMLSKATGDALVSGYGYWIETRDEDGKVIKNEKGKPIKEWIQVIDGGWLESDCFWPTRRYTMSGAEGEHAPRESWTKMTFFPSMIEPDVSPRVTR